MCCFFFFKQKTAYEICSSDVQTCALPIYQIRLAADGAARHAILRQLGQIAFAEADRKSVVSGKRVDLGGRLIIKKKKSTNQAPV